MNYSARAKASPRTVGILVLPAVISFGAPALAQTVYGVDRFNPTSAFIVSSPAHD
ncbi:MAG: hypothetical protein ACLPYZ_00635 [Limisphaerales bacterium]